MKPKTIILTILIVLVLIIVVQNSHAVKVNLLFWSFYMSQIILLPLTLLVGFIVGFIVGKLTGRSQSKAKTS